MDPAEEVASRTGRERRSQVRYPVDGEATLLPLNGHQLLRCRLVDLSLQGCCIRGQQPMRVAAGTRVEVQFKVNGINFRFSETIQWSDGRQQVGIRFPNSLPRQAEDWKAVLAEVEATARKKAAEEHGESKSLNAQPVPREPKILFRHRPPGSRGSMARRPQLRRRPPISPSLGRAAPATTGGRRQGNRSISRGHLPGEERVTFRWAHPRSQPGRLRHPDQGAISPGHLHARGSGVLLQGLTFRLAGVVQTIREQTTVGIRFLDMSERKQAQVIELIAEIRALQESKPEHAVPPVS